MWCLLQNTSDMKSLLDYIKGQQSQLEAPDYDALERINEFKKRLTSNNNNNNEI